ncbi:long-chain-fatty-acid--CoA ligase [SAR86 cluster bacterium]|jgi:fatty-acyl-CoA synthase|nr:long-chain-fatty-acid--CoA ligase [SAR86 cluster bacterium]
MLGNMMQDQLLISGILEHAIQTNPNTEIVSHTIEGSIHRYSILESSKRAKKLANALKKLGIKEGDILGTMALNGYRHYELYFGISGTGSILHTLNPRLFPEQVEYIVNHAEDKFLFIDLPFLPLIESVSDNIQNVEGFIILCDKESMPSDSKLKNLMCYEELIDNESDEFQWPELDENTASSLCYTSGTTGNPKGVLYSHRSTILHAWYACAANAMNVSSTTVILPVVPMFHVNAWGIPYAVAMFGAKLVLPGPHTSGEAITKLVQSEKVTNLMGVPTVWLDLLNYTRENNISLDTVNSVLVGGSAAPRAMIKEFQEKHDAFLLHGWGMTEMSPLGTLNAYNSDMQGMDLEERYDIQTSQGKAIYGCQIKIVDDEGKTLPNDGESFGRLMVKGAGIIERYFKSDETALENGWFDTGDVSTISIDGYMRIVDRSKDVIKTGGEWISSIDLENSAVGHPGVSEACVVGVLHPKWDERPIMFVVKNNQEDCDKGSIIEYLSDKVAKWWLPDDIIFVDELPHGATGKLLKTGLREEYKNHLMK